MNLKKTAVTSVLAITAVTLAVIALPPLAAYSQNKFFGTSNRGVEGGKGNAQINMLMDENIVRKSETTQNAADVDALEGRMGTAEGDIGALEASQTTQDSQISSQGSRIGTLESGMADVEPHAKAPIPGTCHDQNAKLRWNTATSVWECLTEGDPTVLPFAKTNLPTCSASQLLRSNGSGFQCVNAGESYVITESDPKVGAVTAGRLCRGSGSRVECDETFASGDFVQKTGDSMSGPLSTPAPTASAHVATKGYVDAAVASAGGGGGGGGGQTCYYTNSSCGSGFQTMPGTFVSGGSSNVSHNICCSFVDYSGYTCSLLGQSAGGGVCVSAGPYALVAATSDTSGSVAWGSYGTQRGTNSSTNGQGNTAVLAAYGASAHPAASACANLTLGGFDDWYLPASDELDQLYQAKALIGGFSTSNYWSSTEYDSNYAWSQYFGSGGRNNFTKNVNVRVRCVRRAN